MSIYSGERGGVKKDSTVLEAIRKWQAQTQSAQPRVVHSSSKQAPQRWAGIRDWSGSFQQAGYVPLVIPGETFNFKGMIGENPSGSSGGEGLSFEGDAIGESFSLDCNYETNEPIGVTVNFQGNGLAAVLSEALSDEDLSDRTILLPSECVPKIALFEEGSGTPEWTEIEDVVSVNLTCQRALQQYVNSSTARWTKRRSGVFDASLSIAMHGTPDDLSFDIDDYIGFLLYKDASDFVQALWFIVKDFTNIVVDRETNNIIAYTISADYSHTIGSAWSGLIRFGQSPSTVVYTGA